MCVKNLWYVIRSKDNRQLRTVHSSSHDFSFPLEKSQVKQKLQFELGRRKWYALSDFSRKRELLVFTSSHEYSCTLSCETFWYSSKSGDRTISVKIDTHWHQIEHRYHSRFRDGRESDDTCRPSLSLRRFPFDSLFVESISKTTFGLLFATVSEFWTFALLSFCSTHRLNGG